MTGEHLLHVGILGWRQQQQARSLALMALLQRPDPPDLVTPSGATRGYRYRLGGVPHQQDALRLAIQGAYVRWRFLTAGRDESAIVSVRRAKRDLTSTGMT